MNWFQRLWEAARLNSRHEGPGWYDVCMSREWNHEMRTCDPLGKYYPRCPFTHEVKE